MNLKEPPPPDLEGGVAMIVELAVGIAANLPLESRDVYVEYSLPGAPVNAEYMKVESALPALSNPGSGSEGMLLDSADGISLTSTEGGGDGAKDDQGQNQNQNPQQGSGQGAKDSDVSSLKEQQQQQQKKKGMFGGLMNKKPTAGGTGGAEGQAPSGRSSIGTLGGLQQQQQQAVGGGQKEERIRFAAFMAVEVRGRSILVKAPVYV